MMQIFTSQGVRFRRSLFVPHLPADDHRDRRKPSAAERYLAEQHG